MNSKQLRAVLALAFALAGCTRDNLGSIEITGRAAPTDPANCTFAAGGIRLLGPVTYDATLGGGMGVVLYVQNHLVDPSTIDPSLLAAANDWRPENVRLRLNPADYTARYGPSPALPGVTADAFVPVTVQSATPGGGEITQAVSVSASIASALASTAPAGGFPALTRNVVGITLLGRTGDGDPLETAEWYLPVDVCNGCIKGGIAACAGAAPEIDTCPVGQNLPSCIP
ncbi:MAG TPA: hypothetical protein VFP65_17155 [Anaeromyxobacteraceae bacterium]|nr:hypothetical protein [Anaeromyxobacteraceae bacterium]